MMDSPHNPGKAPDPNTTLLPREIEARTYSFKAEAPVKLHDEEKPEGLKDKAPEPNMKLLPHEIEERTSLFGIEGQGKLKEQEGADLKDKGPEPNNILMPIEIEARSCPYEPRATSHDTIKDLDAPPVADKKPEPNNILMPYGKEKTHSLLDELPDESPILTEGKTKEQEKEVSKSKDKITSPNTTLLPREIEGIANNYNLSGEGKLKGPEEIVVLDKKADPNNVLIPYEIEEHIRQLGKKRFLRETSSMSPIEEHRFDVTVNTTTFMSFRSGGSLSLSSHKSPSTNVGGFSTSTGYGASSPSEEESEEEKKKNLNISTQGESIKEEKLNKWQQSGLKQIGAQQKQKDSEAENAYEYEQDEGSGPHLNFSTQGSSLRFQHQWGRKKNLQASNLPAESLKQETLTRAMSGSNYQSLYTTQKKKKDEIEAARFQSRQKEEAEKAQLRQKENAKSAEATILQDQLNFWRGQYNQGQYGREEIDGMVSMLENQLNGIPPEYWNR